eukprot:CAMPEP_0114613966 /NCGR_PEP_ID=MMETSP0168-20121206/5406_1 /TAXON_ID=95228 ORGANISM="Vannella sp., Strain DIVA3 517/6/12" /NCGR_SAMPLE_ID=MMETSP0168 /ASSEMBLY_ACC=CAM_ASM_000044 /LENGTH=870 /DNA_ID=CAMNT_0001824991 /DNA_START=55 /DNA_END=2663 /DNA_ORIENTATION=+
MHVDYYMPEEEREEALEKFLEDEYAQYEKRLKVRDDADFVLESLGLIRKDLLQLDSNEDAVDLHQDMAGISRILEVFGLPLNESVANEPTEINLSDWANLCTFRVIIMRRNITTAKIFVEKTRAPLEICKIEALLHALRQFLEIGEIDEYEMEMLEADEYFDASFLANQSSIEMLYSAPNVEPPPPREVSEEEEEEEEEDEEEEEEEAEKEVEGEEEEEEKEVETEGEKEEEEETEKDADAEAAKEKKEAEAKRRAAKEKERKERKAREKAEAEEEEDRGSGSESSKSRRSRVSKDSTEGEERKKRPRTDSKGRSRGSSSSSSSDGKTKVVRKKSTKDSDGGSTSGSEETIAPAKKKRLRTGSAVKLSLSFTNRKKKKRTLQQLAPMNINTDKELTRETSVLAFKNRRAMRQEKAPAGGRARGMTLEDITMRKGKPLSQIQSESKARLRRNRAKNRRDRRGERLTLAKTKLRKMRVANDKNFNDIILKDELKRHKEGKLSLSSWKKCWAVLNPEKLEILPDEKSASARRVIPLDTIVAIGEGSLAGMSEDSEGGSGSNDDHTFYIDYIGGSVQYRALSRRSLLTWLLALDSLLTNEQIGVEPESLIPAYLKELNAQENCDGAVMSADSEWQYDSSKRIYKRVDGTLESEYKWDGYQLKHSSGHDYGNGVWSGVYLLWRSPVGDFSQEFSFLYYAHEGILRLVDEDHVEEWEVTEFSVHKKADKKCKLGIDGKIPVPLALFTQVMYTAEARQAEFETSRKVSLAGLPKGSPKVSRKSSGGHSPRRLSRSSSRTPRSSSRTPRSTRRSGRSKSRGKEAEKDQLVLSPRRSKSPAPKKGFTLSTSDSARSPRGGSPVRKKNNVIKSPRAISKS